MKEILINSFDELELLTHGNNIFLFSETLQLFLKIDKESFIKRLKLSVVTFYPFEIWLTVDNDIILP